MLQMNNKIGNLIRSEFAYPEYDDKTVESLTIKQFAKKISVSVTTLKLWDSMGILGPQCFGRGVYYYTNHQLSEIPSYKDTKHGENFKEWLSYNIDRNDSVGLIANFFAEVESTEEYIKFYKDAKINSFHDHHSLLFRDYIFHYTIWLENARIEYLAKYPEREDEIWTELLEELNSPNISTKEDYFELYDDWAEDELFNYERKTQQK